MKIFENFGKFGEIQGNSRKFLKIQKKFFENKDFFWKS